MVPGLANLKHIVVLMMENRSFDHLLGFLKSQNKNIDGLTGNESNPDTTGKNIKVQTQATFQGQLNPDPGHHWDDTNIQIFGNDKGTGQATMTGFIQCYFTKRQDVDHSHNIMQCFQPKQVPVVATLATRFAVSDRWYAAIPGPTVPNRMFAHFGTSFGHVDNALKFLDNGLSIYSRMQAAGRSAKVYYFDQKSATIGFTFLLKDQPETYGDYEQFKADCARGTLPDYSFVEPNYTDHDGIPASDQHPDHNVLAGEHFIADVYNNIRANDDLWNSTLLMIVYDEHGGLYDHVVPPPISPDGTSDPETGFKFDRLGIRVPAIFVSPWIEAGTIVRPYDERPYEHSSIPGTVANFFIADAAARKLTPREKGAAVFTDEAAKILTRTSPRTDKFFFGKAPATAAAPAAMPRFAIQARAAKGREAKVIAPKTLKLPKVPASAYNPKREMGQLLRDHINQLAEVEATLPAKQQTGIDVRQLRTEEQASQYIAAVMAVLAKGKKTGSKAKAKPKAKKKAKAAKQSS